MNYKNKLLTSLGIALLVVVSGPQIASAASTPSLGTAGTYSILSSTFTRNIAVTTITGNLGYTTLSGGGSHTVNGITNTPAPAQSGIDQNSASTTLASEPCTFTFAPGAIDLSTDTTHGPIGVYTPGVYCTAASSAASIGTAGLTLSGAGTYIFRIFGALTSAANSQVRLANGASSCDVFWSPAAATTLGANTIFVGTVIDDAGITVGNTTSWFGRALAFGGTVTTDTDIINSSCITGAFPSAVPIATINVVKVVVNDGGGTKTVADFPLFVNGTPVSSGVTNTFPAPAPRYQISETYDSSKYSQSFSGDCGLNGGMSLVPGDNKFCIITNNDIKAPIVPVVPPLIKVLKVASPLSLPLGPGPVTYTYTVKNIGTVPVTNVTMVGDTCAPIILVAGDVNADSKIDVGTTWTFRCTTTLAKTHTNTVVATGWANGISAVDIASATVVVGAPIVPPLIHITKTPSQFTLGVGGGFVTYTKMVHNPGTVPLANVRLTDNDCNPISGPFGDANKNSLLDPSESWAYACRTNLSKTTTNTVFVTGEANGLIARDFAIATVVVAVPKLPNTGIAPDEQNILWPILIGLSVFAVGLLSIVGIKKAL